MGAQDLIFELEMKQFRDNIKEAWRLFALIHQDSNKERLLMLRFHEFIDKVNPESLLKIITE